MAREWKPGDVAVLTLRTRGGRQYPAIRTKLHLGHYVWHLFGDATPGIGEGAVTDARPLVVIDPEDREAVERLADLNERATPDGLVTPTVATDAMQAALREFANPTPPKPEEPTGLGAVVEDAEGERWVRATNFTTVRHWRGCDNHQQGRRRYDEIAVVRVLSEGVQS